MIAHELVAKPIGTATKKVMEDTNSSAVKRQLDGERDIAREEDIDMRHRQATRRKPNGKPIEEENGKRINTKGTDTENGGEATQDEET